MLWQPQGIVATRLKMSWCSKKTAKKKLGGTYPPSFFMKRPTPYITPVNSTVHVRKFSCQSSLSTYASAFPLFFPTSTLPQRDEKLALLVYWQFLHTLLTPPTTIHHDLPRNIFSSTSSTSGHEQNSSPTLPYSPSSPISTTRLLSLVRYANTIP